MIGLAQLQRDFYDYLRGGPMAALAAQVVARGPATTEVRLGIYANAYSKRLTEALESDHEILGRYLGDTLWEQMCADYIAAHPSQCRSLRWYGARLPEFLASAGPFAQYPLLAEIAAFERALLDSFDAADAERLPWSVLTTLSADAWPSLRLGFHPSVRRLTCAWNSVAIWQALKAEPQTPPAAALSGGSTLLWRDAQRITQFRSLDPIEDTALAVMLDSGDDFATLCDRLAGELAIEQVPSQALHLLQQWFATGLIARIEHAAD